MDTMSNQNKKESRFHIVTEDEFELFQSGEETVSNEEKHLEQDSLEKDDFSESENDSDFVSKEDFDNDDILPNSTTEEEFVEDDPDEVYSSNSHKSVSSLKKPYFSFEVRVFFMILGILLMIITSCYMIYKALKYGGSETVTYNEVSKSNYKVCLKKNDVYQQSCLEEGMQYVSSLVNNVSTAFQYDVNFSSDIHYDLSYHIDALMRIYDQNDTSKVLYKKEDLLLEKTSLAGDTDKIHIDTSANIDFTEYSKIVEDYKNRYSIKSTATLDIILYLDEPTEVRKISSISIPLGESTFSIGKYNLNNTNQSVKISVNQWNEYTAFYGIVATVLLLLSMILIFKTARLVLKVTNNRNQYQSKLSQILREYDRIIVVARDGYESNIPKKIIKVANFDDLLDARDALEKPIIYSKVNSIKSEFIVEDDEKLYKYVIKESDF